MDSASSFIHGGTPEMASYRYRAAIPAAVLGWRMNDPSADVLILAKPQAHEAVRSRAVLVADFCDDHFDRFPHYRKLLDIADGVTCPTETMRQRIAGLGRDAMVVPDPFEYPENPPHCSGHKLLWFGHGTNIGSLQRVLPELAGYPLRVVSNVPGSVRWSFGGMFAEFLHADIVILPATKGYKSPNRAVEAIRQGCFVVAEPHPSLNDFPIWKGSIKEGVEWARHNPQKANEMTREAQIHVSKRFSPRTAADAWRRAVESASTSARERSGGRAGLQLVTAATLTPT